MTAYVHIGTVKTGTTSIQTFLCKNRESLKKQKIYYPYIYSGIGSFKFPKIFKIVQDSVYYSSSVSKNKQEQSIEVDKIKNEIINSGEEKIIFSSECIHEFCFTLTDIQNLKKKLLEVGFKKIKIILYLRDPIELLTSFYNTELLLNRKKRYLLFEEKETCIEYGKHIANHKKSLMRWSEVFGKQNIIVRLFDKREFYQQDLLKDFINAIGLEWDEDFFIPERQNETIDLLGIELAKFLNFYLGSALKIDLQKHFTSKDPLLKFQPPKEIVQSYVDYFEESNEWVRKEFFPHKERLFPKKDLSNYKENYELKEMKPEYWDKIAEFIADIVKTKNQNITDKTNIIQNKDKIIID
ncbi:TPA: hypothetical protein R1729_001380, partial [Campylobacter lari]|nr:hypothetical protein [Campylobacter lari]HEC1772309.1 hypothetical protein [Campylobacter lari]